MDRKGGNGVRVLHRRLVGLEIQRFTAEANTTKTMAYISQPHCPSHGWDITKVL